MKRLRDVVPARCPMEGEKVKIESILNLELEFTDWSIRQSVKEQDTEYLILQFKRDERLFVIMTGSRFLIEDVRKYEESAGKESFYATIVKRGKAYVFDS